MRSAPPPNKKRKIKTVHEEKIDFNPAAREEWLTGFHKRKLERRKHAENENLKKEKEEKLRFRKEVGSSPLRPRVLRLLPNAGASKHEAHAKDRGVLPDAAQSWQHCDCTVNANAT
jgi:hypothetical protein